MKKAKLVCIFLLIAFVFTSILPASASTPYANYFITKDTARSVLPIPAPYEATMMIDFKTVEEGKLSNPADIFIADNDRIFIADRDNHRIVVLNPDKTFAFEISGDSSDPDDPRTLNQPSGIYIDKNGSILVADYGNKRLVEFTQNGNFRYAYETPDSEILSSDFSYQPYKVIKDASGYIYVASVGDYRGLLMLSAEGEFRTYFGANAVSLSLWDAIARVLWKREDRKGSVVTLPYTFNNIYSGADGYIYATTTGLSSAQVRKINSAGTDVLYAQYDFSDRGVLAYSSDKQSFCDVTLGDDNNMIVLDSTYGRLYEYDEWGRNLFVFGTNGVGYGQLSSPVSIDMDSKGDIYVVNSKTGVITVFESTKFADTVHLANRYYAEGKYDESFPIWEEVLRQDSYYTLALQALGEIKMREEKYEEARVFFKQAEDAELYSEAFDELRAIFLKKYLSIIATVVIVLLILLIVLKSIKRKRLKKYGPKPEKRTWFTPVKEFWGKIKNGVRHPIDTFEGIRYEGQGFYRDAIIIMILYCLSRVISTLLTAFIFRDGKPLELYNWGQIVLFSFLPWIVVVVVNYGVTTIMYGEGRFRDVFIGGAYCHIPFIVTQIPFAIISQALTQNEAQLYHLANVIVYIWVGVMVYFCIKGVHGFHPVKAVIVYFITAVGVIAVVALAMIVYGLAQQFYEFIIQFAKELSYLV
ncbi:MAG: YIP1 family protein [Clostridia bacterium]|nr:YIP1 family protein [Clostridia bacterium]